MKLIKEVQEYAAALLYRIRDIILLFMSLFGVFKIRRARLLAVKFLRSLQKEKIDLIRSNEEEIRKWGPPMATTLHYKRIELYIAITELRINVYRAIFKIDGPSNK